MAIKQISVFVENKPGRLADITGFLADGGKMCIRDRSDCVARIAVAAGATKEDIVQISFGYGMFTGCLLYTSCPTQAVICTKTIEQE